ncbi:DUF4956 domain-containing protein [Granulosicoccus sp.]|nr:DUF4956 domain-containing protein [Granulosicoccus sp.]
MFNDILSSELIARFFLNAAFLLILLRFVFYGYSRDRDSLFGFFLFGHGVFLVTGLMHEINVSMGFAFGLFAVLSMLRYRTESISIRDMTYLFLVIVMSLMAAVGPVDIPGMMLINASLIAIVWMAETTGFAPKTEKKSVVYDNVKNIRPENRHLLIQDLSERLGEHVVSVQVRSVDFLKDTAVLQLTLAPDLATLSGKIENNKNESEYMVKNT